MQIPAKTPTKPESQPMHGRSNSAVHTWLAFMLRAGRLTRLLPRVRGFYKLRNFYQRHLPQGFLARTKFDGDLLLDLDLRDNTSLFLWHYPSFYEKEEIAAFCSLVTP
jgi:hypothetical protein